ncbi:MAG: diiron oxygenase [Rubrivivax sp.]
MSTDTLERPAEHAPIGDPQAALDATARYARCIEISRRVRWDLETDVIRGRTLDAGRKFMPDALSLIPRLVFLQPHEQRLLSQVQGRTYANMFALVERFIGAKALQLCAGHALGDQTAMEALVRMTDEELKHQAMFRRMDGLAAAVMPDGYRFLPQPDEVARVVLGKSSWAVLALTLDIEIFSQVHYRASIEADPDLDPLWKDVFLFHWKEESQHAVLDELEWRSEDAHTSPEQRDHGVGELLELVGAIDGIVQIQAGADAAYFLQHAGRAFGADQQRAVQHTVLQAYRWQYVVSGAQEPRFAGVLCELATPQQVQRVMQAMGPLASFVQDGA